MVALLEPLLVGALGVKARPLLLRLKPSPDRCPLILVVGVVRDLDLHLDRLSDHPRFAACKPLSASYYPLQGVNFAR